MSHIFRLIIRGKSLRSFIRFAVVVSMFTSLIATSSPKAVAVCPAEQPQSLRHLYTASDLVVVATSERTVITETGEHYSTARTTLRVESIIKGDLNGMTSVDVSHFAQNEPDAVDAPNLYAKGKRLLLFLDKDEAGDSYSVNDEGYGVKALSDADLKIYTTRLEELAQIMHADTAPDPLKITEWLVRCAENAATRWEGIYDLATGEDMPVAENTNDVVVTPVVVTNNGARVDAQPSAMPDQPTEQVEAGKEEREMTEAEMFAAMTNVDRNYAALLTPEQKDRLTRVLIESKEFEPTEQLFAELVAEWNDPRLLQFLIAQLRRMMEDAPYTAEQLVRIIATQTKNDETSKLAEEYCAQSDYSGDDEAASQGKRDRRTRLENFVAHVEAQQTD